MKKKLVLGTIGVLTASLLSACATADSTPTAEELLSNPFGNETISSADFDFIINLDVSSSLADSGFETDGDVSMNTSISADLDCSYDSDTSHVAGNVSANILGMSITERMETYVQTESNGSTTVYSIEDDVWYYSKDEDSEEFNQFLSALDIDSSILKDLSVEDNSDCYVITGKVDYADLVNNISMSGFFEDITSNMENSRGINLDVKISFNKETRLLSGITYTINKDSVDAESSTVINDLELTVNLKKINDVTVVVPTDIINYSKEKVDDFNDFGEFGGSEASDVGFNSGYEDTVPEGTLDWSDSKFTFNNKEFQLGVSTLKDFIEHCGYVCNDNFLNVDTETTLKPGDDMSVNFGLTGNDYVTGCNVKVVNLDSVDKDIRDCVITGVYYDVSYAIKEGLSYIDMYIGDLSIGYKDDLETLLGEPNFTFTFNDIKSSSYSLYHDGYERVIEVNFGEDNEITGLNFLIRE